MILITGATGFLGQRLVHRLVEREGLRCRVLLSPKSDPDCLPVDVETEVGDITDSETMAKAMKGVHTVYHLVGTESRGRHARLWEIDVPGTKAVIEAALDARVGRLIYVSRPGASPASAFPVQQAKGEIEEAIRKSGLAYTIFQTSVLFGQDDHFSEHIAMLARSFPFYFLPGDGETLLQPLWVEDLVTCLAMALEDLDLIDAVVPVGGPELLTYRRIVMRVMHAAGAKRPIISLPYLAVKAGGWFLDGLFARWPFSEFWAELLATNQTVELGTIERQFNFRPRAFDIGLIDHYLEDGGGVVKLARFSLSDQW